MFGLHVYRYYTSRWSDQWFKGDSRLACHGLDWSCNVIGSEHVLKSGAVLIKELKEETYFKHLPKGLNLRSEVSSQVHYRSTNSSSKRIEYCTAPTLPSRGPGPLGLTPRDQSIWSSFIVKLLLPQIFKQPTACLLGTSVIQLDINVLSAAFMNGQYHILLSLCLVQYPSLFCNMFLYPVSFSLALHTIIYYIIRHKNLLKIILFYSFYYFVLQLRHVFLILW